MLVVGSIDIGEPNGRWATERVPRSQMLGLLAQLLHRRSESQKLHFRRDVHNLGKLGTLKLGEWMMSEGQRCPTRRHIYLAPVGN
jgi:hypothetical protein